MIPMKSNKLLALTMAATMMFSVGCADKGISQPEKHELSKSDTAILQDAVIDIDEVARLCESAKPDINAIEKRCQTGLANADKVKDKDKKKLMQDSYNHLLDYVKNKGQKDAYQNFVKALQSKEQLN